MKSVSEARDLILAHAEPLSGESVPLCEALHRVLCADANSDADSPPFDCSAMDGYALRSADAGCLLEVVAEIQAGEAREFEIGAGQCARIFTGAKIPAGADCVLMQERAVFENGRLRVPNVSASDNIRERGENCRRGDVIVKAGCVLHAEDLAALASCGVAKPLVFRRPRVVHFVTGDELVDPSESPAGSQIRDSNSILIASLLAECGAELVHQSRLRDCLETSMQTLAMHGDFDVLLISGGASVGSYDFTRPLLEKSGFEIHLHGVNIRPGKPLIFGSRGQQLAFGLPGNPVAHAVIFRVLLAPLFSAMMGADRSVEFFQGWLENDFSLEPNPRETYWPCRAEWREGAFRLHPLRFQGSGDITGVAQANALFRIPPNHPDAMIQNHAADFLWLRSPG